MLPASGFTQQEVGDVAAGDEEHKKDRTKQWQQKVAAITVQEFDQGLNFGSNSLIKMVSLRLPRGDRS